MPVCHSEAKPKNLSGEMLRSAQHDREIQFDLTPFALSLSKKGSDKPYKQ